jgi:multicomponent Na+:H+ antiporter subunit C
VFIFTAGLYLTITEDSYLRKIIGLSILQTAVIMFFVTLSKVNNGIAPFDKCLGNVDCQQVYSSAINHVLMLTAIVVGFSTLSVGLAIIYRIKNKFGTISERELNQ